MSTGTAPSARRRRQTSTPERRGIITSRTTRSKGSPRARASAFSPSPTDSTSTPSVRSAYSSGPTMSGSSSATRIRALTGLSRRLLLGQSERDAHDGALARSRLELDVPADGSDRLPDDREAEPESVRVAGATAVEPLPHALLVGGGDTGGPVAHLDRRGPVGEALGGEHDPSALGVLGRVHREVEKRLLDERAVGEDGETGRALHGDFDALLGLERDGDLPQQGAELERLEARRLVLRLRAREREQRVGEAPEAG